jgi:hypothetical protein
VIAALASLLADAAAAVLDARFRRF